MKIGGNCSEPFALVRVDRARRVEKPAESNDLRGDARRYPARSVAIVKMGTAVSVSLCGTRVIESADNNLLQATFVAQVLGQILDTSSDNRIVAARAYDRSDYSNTNPLFAEIA